MAGGPTKAHRPIERPFWQQKLPAWSPVLSAKNAAMPFLVIGCIFVPTGVTVFVSNSRLQEYQFDYTLCKKHNTNQTCATVIAKDPRLVCVCYELINLPEDFRHTVNVYYGLTSFYQNFRLYVQSRDDVQLLGNPNVARSPCHPLDVDPRNNYTIFPCGAVANSLFNDTLRLRYKNGPGNRPVDVPLIYDNISWPTDLTRKFRNPEKWNPAGTVKPPNWEMPIHQLKNGLQNEAFVVWMRTAALPSLRKLYARVDATGDFTRRLPKGEYILEIHYRYPVTIFGGTKRLILSNASWMGSRNPFIAIAYVSVGCLCVVLGVSFKAIDHKFSSVSFPLPATSDFCEQRRVWRPRKPSLLPLPLLRRDSTAGKPPSVKSSTPSVRQ